MCCLHITFTDEDADLGSLSQTEFRAPVRMGGDALDGTISFQGPATFQYKALVSLEGCILPSGIRPRLGGAGGPRQRRPIRFLQQSQLIVVPPKQPNTDESPADPTANDEPHQIPFHFIVSPKLIDLTQKIPMLYDLYPSTRSRLSVPDQTALPLLCDTFVAYFLYVTVKGKSGPVKLRGCGSREVLIFPTLPVPPPICVDWHPGEYCLTVTRKLRKNIISRPRAVISLSAQEPAVLRLDHTGPSRPIVLDVSVDHHSSVSQDQSHHLPPGLGFRVQTRLSRRIIYSTAPLQSSTSIMDVEKSSEAGQQVDISASMTTMVADREWQRYIRSSSLVTRQRDKQDSPLAITWRTQIQVVHQAPTSLTPSFHGPQAAARYSVIISVNVEGYKNLQANLVVPLQVIYAQVHEPLRNHRRGPREEICHLQEGSGETELGRIDLLNESRSSSNSYPGSELGLLDGEDGSSFTWEDEFRGTDDKAMPPKYMVDHTRGMCCP